MTAFEVMTTSLKERHKDYVFSVYMRPPTPVKRELNGQIDEQWYSRDKLSFAFQLSGVGILLVLIVTLQVRSLRGTSNRESLGVQFLTIFDYANDGACNISCVPLNQANQKDRGPQLEDCLARMLASHR
ncbi:hypothetical protein B0H13DRAFT_1880820 [Mycena leptocephala]|nr:hypothetical protein B0H13DRAFT_1880820 [Mycena leptocephala]